MDPSTLLNRPKTFNVTPKITKISNLSIASAQARKSSTKLVKVFEKGTYQKKTQLSVLNRYKKRLESIQKQNDKSFSRKKNVKVKLPDIKKYVGNFFTPGSTNDPLKAIGALAAFTALQKGSKGDWGGALGSGLVAAGLLGGGALTLKGVRSALPGRNAPAATPQMGVPGASAGSFFGTPYAQTKAGKSYASMQQFRNLPQWAKGLSSSSASRFAASNERIIQGTANVGDRLRVGTRGLGMQGVGGVAENLATSGPPKISPRFGLLNAALFGLDYMGRKSSGQSNIQAGVGAGAGVGGALLGAAIGSALFPGVGTVAGLLIGAAFSTGGALIASAIADKATGVGEDKLKKQTQQQKAELEKKKDGGGKLTFSKTLNSYGRAVAKFEDFAKGFVGGMGMSGEQSGVIETGNRGMETGQDLQDMEATGGEVPGTPYSPYGPRSGKMHQGNDYAKPSGTAISVIQPGTVTVADMNYDPTGWGAVVEIRHQDGSLSRYAHLSKIHVAAGTQISPGQVIGLTGGVEGAPGSGNSRGPHLHFEYETSAGRVDPTSVAPKIFRFGGNVKVKQRSQQQLQQQIQTPTTPGQSGSRSNQLPTSNLSQARPRRMPVVSQNLPYQEGYSQTQPTIVPYPVVRQQQAAASASSAPMMFPGPSEQQLLNSFYKKVLLNTVQ
jgi:murein DD-endopeptidase MepM/ murein hydrolase activator NlpD